MNHVEQEAIQAGFTIAIGIIGGSCIVDFVWLFVWLIDDRRWPELIKGWGVFSIVGAVVGQFAAFCVL